jgi:hypothetical protein
MLEEKVFFLSGKFFSGKDSTVKSAEKFPVSGADRESFDQYAIDLGIPGRIIIASPIPFKVLNAGSPDLHRNPPLLKVFHGSPGLGFSPSRDIRPIPGADKSNSHFSRSGQFSLFSLFGLFGLFRFGSKKKII